ncbi:hypothetical protein RHMOL_Rhmol11G0245200 [Rhododendron molle]|uniref:Uncharacterized protein n=1 Tax=Rhododendron molle TaxID=49168 RepID=A0ACC0LWU3_RHOML|nr:hypothetical protein RHMOL_Rhmol11G0245200 [Rhododendron molle]
MHCADKFLLHNLGQEISKLDFCKLSKVDRQDTHPAHCLAKRGLLPPSMSPDSREIPLWSGATADRHLP